MEKLIKKIFGRIFSGAFFTVGKMNKDIDTADRFIYFTHSVHAFC